MTEALSCSRLIAFLRLFSETALIGWTFWPNRESALFLRRGDDCWITGGLFYLKRSAVATVANAGPIGDLPPSLARQRGDGRKEVGAVARDPSNGRESSGRYGPLTVVGVVLAILLILALILLVGVGLTPDEPIVAPPDVAGPGRGTEGAVPEALEPAFVGTPVEDPPSLRTPVRAIPDAIEPIPAGTPTPGGLGAGSASP